MASEGPSDQARWDQRYRDADRPGAPARVLVEFQHLLPDHGVALDLAAGLGGNALLLAWYGLATHAWDISPVAMERLRGFAAERGLSVPFGSLTKALRPTGLPPDTPLRRSSPWT